MITTENLKRGDLCVFSGYGGKLHPGVFKGLGQGTYQFWRLTAYTVEGLKSKVNPGVEYIGGSNKEHRVVRVHPSVLDQEEQALYEQLKKLI